MHFFFPWTVDACILQPSQVRYNIHIWQPSVGWKVCIYIPMLYALLSN
jgi:hypothetical protein